MLFSNLPRYQTRHPSDYGESRGGGRGHRRSPSPPSQRNRERRREGGDDEDIDAMIANLKKKTSGRDMYDVIRGIEQHNE